MERRDGQSLITGQTQELHSVDKQILCFQIAADLLVAGSRSAALHAKRFSFVLFP